MFAEGSLLSKEQIKVNAVWPFPLVSLLRHIVGSTITKVHPKGFQEELKRYYSGTLPELYIQLSEIFRDGGAYL
jgi:hypothetical protein